MNRVTKMRRLRVVNVAAAALNVVAVTLNVITGSLLALLPLAMLCALVVTVAFQTRVIRRWEREHRRPDYDAIARMEREAGIVNG